MPGTKRLTVVQEAKLAELIRVKGERDRFLDDVHERQRVERAQAVSDFESDLSRLANECRTMGVVHRRIQSVLGLQNWDSYKKLRELTLGSIALRKSAEEMVVDAEPVEILEREESEPGRGGPWIRFKAKESGVVGDMWANRSGNWDFVWREVSPSRHEVQVWYSDKFGVGNV